MRYRRVVCHELIGIALHADSADFSGHSKGHMPVSRTALCILCTFE